MKIGKKLIIILLCLYAEKAVWAEEYPDWEGYPSLFSMTDLIEFKGRVYGTCENGVLCYDPLNKEYKLFYKNHGLEASNILSIASTSSEIFIGFKNDGLMRFDPDEESFDPILFPEYVDKEDVLKTIAVNDIFALNDSILFIGHSKGVDKLNLNTEVLYTYSKLSVNIKEDTPVDEVKVFKNKIWACTPGGLAWADVDNQNLESEENWGSFQFPTGVNTIYNFIDEENDEDMIFVGTNGSGIFSFNSDSGDTLYSSEEDFSVYSITGGLGTCFAATDNGLYMKYEDDWLYIEASTKPLRALVPDGDDVIWIATGNDGLRCYRSSGYWKIPAINGPRNSTFRKIDVTKDNVVWAATSIREQYGYVQRFQDNIWEWYDEDDGLPSSFTNAVHVDSRGNLWGATWGRGVYTLDDSDTVQKEDDIIIHIDPEREIILPTGSSKTFTACPDVTEDKHGNIWIADWDKGVIILEGNLPINEYKYYNFLFDDSGSLHYIRRVFCDDNGWVWLGTQQTGLIGLFVGEDPYDISDDQTKYISLSDGLLGYLVEAIHTDKNGYVWVGTDGGLNRIEILPGSILKVEDMNYLLREDTIEIICIEVDRFDNKWIGTSNGLIKLNPRNKFVQVYNTSNSGLFSNSILSLRYDNNDMLWVGTDSGLNKFYVIRADSDESDSQFHVYPNPFEIWGYNSRAVFNNLKPANPVRIYNFTGDLVNEVISGESDDHGASTVEWNGCNFKNEFVGSGVYFFTGIDKNGHGFREKMVVIRR